MAEALLDRKSSPFLFASGWLINWHTLGLPTVSAWMVVDNVPIKLPGLPCPIRLVIGGTIVTLRLVVGG